MSTIEHDPASAATRLGAAEMAWLKAQRRAGGLWLRVAIAVPLVAGLFTVAQAFTLATIIDRALVGNVPPADKIGQVLQLVAIICARAGLALLGERLGSRASEDVKRAIRESLQASIMARSPEWLRERSSGVLASQLVDGVEALDGYFARFLPAMIAAAVLPLAFAIGLMPVDIVVGALFLVTAPLIPLFMALVGWGAEAASRRHMTAMTRLSGLFADRLRGILVLKLFGRAEDEVARVKAASDDVAKRTLQVLRIAFLSSAVLEFFAAIGVAGVALYVGLTYVGFIDLRGSTLGLQAGLFCLLMAPEVYMPLRTLAAHYHDRAAAKAAVADFAALIDTPEDVAASAAPTKSLPTGALPVTIRRLTLHAAGRGVILDDVDLDILAGARIAILGPSGIGKSSLIEAMARLRSFEGSISIGGVPLGEIDEGSLRREVALLGQRPRLFHGTIADNIRLARRDATDSEVSLAADRALVGDFADRTPDGLETAMGERGRGVSGGEAHRVALARIFLRDPGLILLDEPTAHLDAVTEARIIDAILAFAEGRTLVVVTHSEAVARSMDRIYRIAGGRLLPVPHRPVGVASARRERGDLP
ncbi:ATP-binding cassette, subfamily C, CydD [Kaistia soli DSM 19436]|uniref:ATP-binding cassette, subfamily C, CydD n=1 Tax=Kaistia soli DSM 19436 TaxID=1122133 RepID=A0A1M5H3V2_9HYPH|nr:thiol reductant ABC exporter subunit CydD [Kaistia soli]SHG10566.1 ATP-binding cassette, subfamily C, CydD [Kaistia soli DSM 19436]